ncbi:vanadium-dependent haloperoxidase [Pedobacter sp. L105]|uniref:vanadium-dependent haloperoxidase n=1 Tax=Pedobacter sp. L105 TaxID=1641871 RepID=UPI00131C895B|nr:vanadium-dependent haloperoxidase [Pedobacter sp. L105]
MKTRNLLVVALLYSANLFAHAAKSLPDYLEIRPVINAVNMVMIHDVVSPPVASRYYSYIMLGSYTIVSQNNQKVPAPSSFISRFPTNITTDVKGYDYRIAAIYCVLETSKIMLPSGYLLQDDEDTYVALLRKNKISEIIITQSIELAKQIAAQVINFSKTDGYGKLSGKLRYTPKKGDAYWYPTPPAYLDAVEPNWTTIKPLVLDSSSQFKPTPATPYSKDTTSNFYHLARQVYDASKNQTPESLNKANFWDCNPFAVTTSGHMMIGFKKISPAGHWMNIACLVVKKANLGFDQSIVVVTMESISLMDAFIACWDEKYRSNRVRPETYINRNIDLKWRPVLQTPPFPENTSGHAVASNASAAMLTYLLGDHFAYTDDTEIPFGSGIRSFTSFTQAAEEASISRFYGGIHFMDSIKAGNKQGKDVAGYIIEKIKKAGITRQN